jgi:hypothetical protein
MTSVELKPPPSRATVLVAFLLFGPPIGALTTSVLFLGLAISKDGIGGIWPDLSSLAALQSWIGLVMTVTGLFVMFGYLLGTLPAAVTAFMMIWLWRRRWPVVKRYSAAGLLGAITGALPVGLLIEKHHGVATLFGLLSGSVAAIACTWLIEWRQRQIVS